MPGRTYSNVSAAHVLTILEPQPTPGQKQRTPPPQRARF